MQQRKQETRHQQRVHRDVKERVADFLTVSQRACARRASKALWEAVRAASMEDMLRATVVVDQGAQPVDVQVVVAAMSRASGPLPSADALLALLAWSGGLGPLYDELQLRFPYAAAIGISARLAAVRPFPFASGCTTMTVCVVTAAASDPSALVIESVVLGVHNATNVFVRTLSHNGAPCSVLCLEAATREQISNIVYHVPLSPSLPSLRTIVANTFEKCNKSLQSINLSNLLLESIGDYAFACCAHLSSVDLSSLTSLLCFVGQMPSGVVSLFNRST